MHSHIAPIWFSIVGNPPPLLGRIASYHLQIVSEKSGLHFCKIVYHKAVSSPPPFLAWLIGLQHTREISKVTKGHPV